MRDSIFDSLNLNDSLVKRIIFFSGKVHVHLVNITNYETQSVFPTVLRFLDRSEAATNMNLDVAWPESILLGTVEEVDGDVNLYTLEMNTRGSILKIRAKRCEMMFEDDEHGSRVG